MSSPAQLEIVGGTRANPLSSDVNRSRGARMRIRRSARPPQILQILVHRQVVHFEIYPETLLEWLRGAAAVVAGAEFGDAVGLLLYTGECWVDGVVCAGFGGTGAWVGIY
jgi:hypothetical protein